LKTLHANGIGTYVFIGPILPMLTNCEKILKSVHKYIDGVMAEILNIRCGNWNDIQNVLDKDFPAIQPGYKDKIKNKENWSNIENNIIALCKEYNLPLIGFYRH